MDINNEEPYETMEEISNKREAEIFNAIREHINKHGYGPSMKEIVDSTTIQSTSTAYKYAKRLKQKGLVTWKEGRSGTLILVHQNN